MTDYESVVRRLREANPVASLAALHEEELEAVRSLLDRRRGRMTATSTPTQTTPRWRRPALAAGAAFIVTLAAVGTTLLLLRGSGRDVVATTTTPAPTTTLAPTTTSGPTTTAETPTTTVPPPPAGLAMTWVQAPTQEAFDFNDFIWSVVEAGSGLVAVGGVSETPGELDYTDGAVWVSEDGAAWERAGDPSVFSGVSTQFGTNMNQVITDIAEGPAGLIATGWVDRDTGDTALPIWLSPDGNAWSRHPADLADYPDAQPRGLLLATDNGYALVEGIGGAVWSSPDGMQWVRTVAAGTVAGPTGAAISPTNQGGIIAWGPGYAAVGVANSECAGNGIFACWGDLVGGYSPDGEAWETALLGTSRGWVFSLAAVGDRMMALGYDESGIAVWTSADGIAWERSEVVAGLGRAIALWDALSNGDRLLAAGGEYLGYMAGAAVAFASEDGGATWHEVLTASSSPEGPYGGTADQSVPGIRDLIAWDDRILGVGGTGNGSAPVWIGSWDQP